MSAVPNSSATSKEFLDYAKRCQQEVDAALDRILVQPAEDPLKLREAMRYAVLSGGKRMRPVVVLAAAEALGVSREAAMPAACALEMVHAYSLVHDDLPAMDDDAERRGRPTVHVAFGEGAAILVGDALLTEAFAVLARDAQGPARTRVADAVALLARHAGIDGMVGGQALDIAHGQDIADLERLERVHALKTGALYAAAAALGAMAADASADLTNALERWGLGFGIAFQHADDALDDEQPRLRQAALARVEALVAQGEELLNTHQVPQDAMIRAVGPWVLERAQRAAQGDKQDA